MQITELGLRPCLWERTEPLDTQLDLAMLDKIEQRAALKQKLNRRKKRLKAMLQKIDAA